MWPFPTRFSTLFPFCPCVSLSETCFQTARLTMCIKQNQNEESKNVSLQPCFVVKGYKQRCQAICPFDRRRYTVLPAVSRCDFYVKIADQNLERSADEMGWRGMDWHGEDAQRLAALRWPRFTFGVLFLMIFFSFRFDPLFYFFPVTMISTDCSSCSFVSASLPNVVQRQPLFCPCPFKPITA